MSLENLSDELREAVIALPYRVGYFVSVADRTGGAESDQAELESLEHLLTFYAEDAVKGEFSQTVMAETLRRKVYWSSWRGDIANVPREARDVLTDLEIRVDEKNLRAFKYNLYEIAQTVAQSFSETDYTQPTSGFVGLVQKIFGLTKKTTQNISASEQAVLQELVSILNISTPAARKTKT